MNGTHKPWSFVLLAGFASCEWVLPVAGCTVPWF